MDENLIRLTGTVLLKPSGWGVCDGEADLQLLDVAKDSGLDLETAIETEYKNIPEPRSRLVWWFRNIFKSSAKT